MNSPHAIAPPPGGEHAPPPAGWAEGSEAPALRWLHRLEDSVPVAALGLMVALPLAEIVARRFGTGVPGSAPFTQHLTLWVAFLGAAIAARQGKLLALATGSFLPAGPWREGVTGFAAAVGAGVSALLARASLEMALVERQSGTIVAAGVPSWVAQL